MKAFKETIRKYYKYVSWTQPVFTSATTWGNVSADSYSTGSNQYPWQALDGKTSGGDEADFASGDVNNVNWYWDFAESLKITNVKIWNRNNAGNYGGATTYTIYGKNKDNSYEQIGTVSLAATGWVSGETAISSTKKYYGIKIYCLGTKNYVGIGEILLTAYTSQESTSSDYDFYEDVTVYKMVAKGSRTYYDELTFESSSSLQKWVVPNGITKLHVDCVASKGKNYNSSGGNGGRVQCDLSVTTGQILYITVGGISSEHISAPFYNASDIRTNNAGLTDNTSLQSRLIVAGGGGNGCNHSGVGGAGGGLTGGTGGSHNTGYAGGGSGGTQASGGAGGKGNHFGGGTSPAYHHHDGGNGVFGLGGAGSYEGSYEGPSGAGGAGWYGGGGGAGSWNHYGAYTAGGGGGSSYTDSTVCSNVTHTQGYNNGEGYITISTLNGEHFYRDDTVYKAFKE